MAVDMASPVGVKLASLVTVNLDSSVGVWLRWEQAGCGGSGFAGLGECGIAVSMLVAVDGASLVRGCYIKFMEE